MKINVYSKITIKEGTIYKNNYQIKHVDIQDRILSIGITSFYHIVSNELSHVS